MLNIKKLNEEHLELLKTTFYKEVPNNNLQEFINDPNVVAYIALLDNKVIGFIYGYILKRINTNPMLYIHSVDVVKEHQGTGIGTMLMDEVLHLKKEKKFYKMFLITNKSNENAMALYKKVGGVQRYNDDVVFEYK